MLEIYLAKTEDITSVSLPNNLEEHTNQYRVEKIRNISRYAYFMVTKILASHGFLAEHIEFTPKGKGVLEGIYFSISHSDNYIAVAVSDNPIGVDVEEWLEEDRFRLAKKILTQEELNQFEEEKEKSKFLTEKWTMKEAYSKMLGTGLTEEIFSTLVDGECKTLEYGVLAIYPKKPFDVHIWGDDDYGKSE